MKTNFQISVQRGLNGTGTIKELDNGYYLVVLGTLESPNSTGAVYDLESAANIIERSKIFNRRMEQGYLRGELGHPRERDCKDYNDFVRRIHSIEEDKVVVTYRRVYLDRNYVGNDGKRCIAIMGEVAGSGPFAHVFDRAMKNPYENVAFSVRAMTDDRIVGGVRRKFFENIITWDMVNEPGLSAANKYNSPSCESYSDEITVSVPVTEALVDVLTSTIDAGGVSQESMVSMESSLSAIRRLNKDRVSVRRTALEKW